MLHRSDAEKDFAKLGTAWWLGGAVCVGLLRRVMPDGAPGCSVDSRGTLRVCGLPAQPTQRSAICTASSRSPSPRPSAQPALPAGARGRVTADREYKRASCSCDNVTRGRTWERGSGGRSLRHTPRCVPHVCYGLGSSCRCRMLVPSTYVTERCVHGMFAFAAWRFAWSHVAWIVV